MKKLYKMTYSDFNSCLTSQLSSPLFPSSPLSLPLLCMLSLILHGASGMLNTILFIDSDRERRNY